MHAQDKLADPPITLRIGYLKATTDLTLAEVHGSLDITVCGVGRSGGGATGTAHLPSLVRPAEVTRLLAEFINRCCGRPG